MEDNGDQTTLSTTDGVVVNSAGAEEELSLQLYLFMAFMLPVCAIIVIGNSLVLIAPWKFPKLRIKQHVYLMNVAVADLATGLLATPIILLTELRPQLMSEFFFCVSRMTIAYTGTVASNFLLLASSIERYVAIQHPFLHEKTCSRKTIALSIMRCHMGLCLSDGNVAVSGVEQLVARYSLLRGPRVSVSLDDPYLLPSVCGDDCHWYVVCSHFQHSQEASKTHCRRQHGGWNNHTNFKSRPKGCQSHSYGSTGMYCICTTLCYHIIPGIYSSTCWS